MSCCRDYSPKSSYNFHHCRGLGSACLPHKSRRRGPQPPTGLFSNVEAEFRKLNLRRRESFPIFSLQNLRVGFLVIREAEVGRVPAQFLARKARGLHGQEGGLGDAPTDRQRRPEWSFGTQAIVRPVFPMIAGRDVGEWFVIHHFSFAENSDFAVGLEEERAFLTDDHGLVGADLCGRQTEGGKGGLKASVVVMHHEFLARKISTARIREGAQVMRGVARG